MSFARHEHTSSIARPDGERPGNHPEPPKNLDGRTLPIRETSNSWVRVHSARHDPIYFGKAARNWFDAPEGEFGVMYVGMDPYCAIIETVELSSFLNVFAVSSVEHLALATIEPTRTLRLVDPTADGLIRLGCDARLTIGSYAVAQRWSRALWLHPAAPDGLLYRSRYDPSRLSAALFEGVSDVVVADRLGSLAETQLRDVLRQVLDTYGLVLVED